MEMTGLPEMSLKTTNQCCTKPSNNKDLKAISLTPVAKVWPSMVRVYRNSQMFNSVKCKHLVQYFIHIGQ